MKKLFSTPKRAVITTLCIVFLVLATAAAAVWAVRSSQISRSEAIAAALADAGLKESEVSALRARLEFDDGRFQYEVDFYCDGVTYEYAVQAKDGDVISRDIEGGSVPGRSGQGNPSGKENAGGQKAPIGQDGPAEGQAPAGQKDPAAQGSGNGGADVVKEGDIGAERAKEIALEHAGLTESDVRFVKAERDRDDGMRSSFMKE